MNESVYGLEIYSEILRVSRLLPKCAWYIFGSLLKTPHIAADIDLLILCDCDEAAIIARQELELICTLFPLDLFILTQAEEKELGFIASQGCVDFFQLETQFTRLTTNSINSALISQA